MHSVARFIESLKNSETKSINQTSTSLNCIFSPGAYLQIKGLKKMLSTTQLISAYSKKVTLDLYITKICGRMQLTFFVQLLFSVRTYYCHTIPHFAFISTYTIYHINCALFCYRIPYTGQLSQLCSV